MYIACISTHIYNYTPQTEWTYIKLSAVVWGRGREARGMSVDFGYICNTWDTITVTLSH